MYLVHVQLRPPAGRRLPDHVAGLVAGCIAPDEAVEHVTFHPEAVGGPVVGLFLLSTRLDEAEQTASAVCERAIATCPELRGCLILRSEVPLLEDPVTGGRLPITDPDCQDPSPPF